MSCEKPIRPRPAAGSLADQVRALGSIETGEDGRKVGALNDRELELWTEELAREVAKGGAAVEEGPWTNDQIAGQIDSALAERVAELEARLEAKTDEVNSRRVCATEQARRIHDLEQRIVDLLALELVIVSSLRAAGVIAPDAPPPPTTEVVRMLKGET